MEENNGIPGFQEILGGRGSSRSGGEIINVPHCLVFEGYGGSA